MNKQLFLAFVASLFFVFSSSAQKNTLFLDDLAFPCINSKNIASNISYQAILTELNKSNNLKQVVASLKSTVHQNNSFTLLAFAGDYNNDLLKKEISHQFGNNVFICTKEADWPSLDSLQKENKPIVAILNERLSFSSTKRIRNLNTYKDRFSKDPLDKLVVFKPNETDSLYAECIAFWKTTGKVPNLVLLPSNKISGFKPVLDSINQMRRLKGLILHNGTYLNEIYWKERPEMITPAKFSFPLTGYSETLSPFKNGYTITPGEILHSTSLQDVPRMFNAYETAIEDQLIVHFSFNKEITNQIEPEWDRIINQDVSIVEDLERGNVLKFSSDNSYIDYGKENDLNFDTPITVATWIKADSMANYMGIVGLGSSFSLKLSRGIPDFTTASIKDHMINMPLKLDEWYHLAVIFNPNTSVEFYINGEKTAVINASRIMPSKQSLIIGNNIWGEQFFGSIDDLKIWDRGLSEKEIKSVFLSQESSSSKKGRKKNVLTASLFLLILGIVIFVIHSYRKKQQKPAKLTAKTETTGIKNQIKLFGSFQVYTEENGDITNRFSPLLRQILAFFILNTPDNPEGISTKKISDTFWPGTPKEKAKENRGTNIKKLRKQLDGLNGISIVYQNKKWSLSLNKSVDIDYLLFKKLKSKIIKQKTIHTETIDKLLTILKNGNILQNLEQEWLDNYKNNISDEVIELLKHLLAKLEKNFNLQIETAKTILQFDPLNEEALDCILTILAAQGNHGQARQFYDDFCKKYLHLYNEEYPLSYTQIIKK